MKNYLKENKTNIIFSAVSILLMWLIWIIAYFSVGNEYVVPSFSETVASLFACFTEGEFWLAFLWTVLRTSLAFVVSFLSALLCAVGAVYSKILKYLLSPFVTLLRTLPTMAVILLILIWTNPYAAPVIVTVLVLFPMIYSQMTAALEGGDAGLSEMAKVYKIEKKDVIFKILLPRISTAVYAQTGANFSLGIKLTISAEVLSSTFMSLGGLMQSARAFLEMPRLCALTIIAVVTGFSAELAFSRLRLLNRKWRQDS